MEPQSKGLSLDESVTEVMKTLPPFIREYLAQGKYTPVAQGLMGKYKLRIDQGGVLERELLLLLMGIEAPNEFVDALSKEAQINQETVNNIVQDINEQVFVPLRKQEEELAKNRSQSARPLAPQPAPPRPTPPTTRPTAPLPPHVAPLPPKVAMPKPGSSLGDIVRSVVSKPVTSPDRLLPKEDPATLLEDHEEPHIDIAPKALVPPPAAAKLVMPAAPAMPAPQQAPATPRPQMPTAPTPAPMSAPKPVPPITPPTPKAPPPPPITSYSVDPYREPIDDEKE